MSNTRTLTVVPVPGPGAEDVLVGPDGTVYTGTGDGSIFAVSPDGNLIRRIANTGGRPLGLDLLAEDRLLVCDSQRGLLAVPLAGGAVEVLAGTVAGVPMRLCNNAAVLGDGTIFFSDSSTEWGLTTPSPTSSPTPARAGCSGSIPVRRSRKWSWTTSASPTAWPAPRMAAR
jgi:sugar lactone lactonase YvrE